MGQKIHPTGFRLSVLRNWSSKWYANSKAFPGMLQEDLKVRDFLKQKLAHAAVSKIVIERPAKNAKITIFSARPGIVIGKKGEDIEKLRSEVARRMRLPMQDALTEEDIDWRVTVNTRNVASKAPLQSRNFSDANAFAADTGVTIVKAEQPPRTRPCTAYKSRPHL